MSVLFVPFPISCWPRRCAATPPDDPPWGCWARTSGSGRSRPWRGRGRASGQPARRRASVAPICACARSTWPRGRPNRSPFWPNCALGAARGGAGLGRGLPRPAHRGHAPRRAAAGRGAGAAAAHDPRSRPPTPGAGLGFEQIYRARRRPLRHAGAVRLVGKTDETRFSGAAPRLAAAAARAALQQLHWLGIRTLGQYGALPPTRRLAALGAGGQTRPPLGAGPRHPPCGPAPERAPEPLRIDLDPPTDQLGRVLAELMEAFRPTLSALPPSSAAYAGCGCRCTSCPPPYARSTSPLCCPPASRRASTPPWPSPADAGLARRAGAAGAHPARRRRASGRAARALPTSPPPTTRPWPCSPSAWPAATDAASLWARSRMRPPRAERAITYQPL